MSVETFSRAGKSSLRLRETSQAGAGSEFSEHAPRISLFVLSERLSIAYNMCLEE